jgi:hypothetical protein
MAATQYDFSIEQGSSFTISLIYKDSSGSPIDLTGWCARLVIATDNNETITFVTTNSVVGSYSFTLGGALGTIVLQIPASVTNTYDFNAGRYDLELESINNLYSGGGHEIIRLLYGDISLIKRYSENTILLDC